MNTEFHKDIGDEGAIEEIKAMYNPEMTQEEWVSVVKQEFEQKDIYDPDGYLFTETVMGPVMKPAFDAAVAKVNGKLVEADFEVLEETE